MTPAADERDDDLEELYEDAPCGCVSTTPHGAIVRVNRTFAAWTGHSAEALLAGKRFPDLLTAPGRLFYETHCAPLMQLKGFVSEIAADLVAADGRPLPMLINAVLKRDEGGEPLRIRLVVFHATTRREYERELMLARRKAEETAELLRAQAELLAEHSAMLIPIHDGLRVMPLLGAIDPTRGRVIVRALMNVDTAAVRVVILDLTGVPELDEAATEVLRAAIGGLRLRGVRAILTGIRPAVATALASRGLDLAGTPIRGTLQDGIALARQLSPPRR